MSAPAKIIQLVNQFKENYNQYKLSSFNEENLKIEFLNPFFEELGWDIQNKKGFSQQYKDVVFEDSIKVGHSTLAPDYSFRYGGVRKFFVEAKKPSENIDFNAKYSYQLRRYAWSAKLPISILTDFEEFAVYNTRIKPNENDKPSIARIFYYRYTEYIDKWDEIYSIFSKEAIPKGAFDRFADDDKLKRGTSEVDEEFLKEIEGWRSVLALNLALRNKDLTKRQLNDSVQKTIDRLIFLRICEDRGIENYGLLQSKQNVKDVYSHLKQLFLIADDKYNSGLFNFSYEKNRTEPDELTLNLNVDDKVLKDIIKRLYPPTSPYAFSVIPIEILGQVYERFLGNIIDLKPNHKAIVELKPEVRKAGGVYYTPQYIVNYIVENSVCILLANKTAEDAKKLKILDPACGSGSFLI